MHHRHRRSAVALTATIAATLLLSPGPAGAAMELEPLPPVEPGDTVLLTLHGVTGGCHLSASIDGQPAPQFVGFGNQFILTANLELPATVRDGAVLTISGSDCNESVSQILRVIHPVIRSASAEVTVPVGGETAYSAGATITISGIGFGMNIQCGQLLLDDKPFPGQILAWWPTWITAVLPPDLPTGHYMIAVRTGGGVSNAMPLAVLSVPDFQRAQSGQIVRIPPAGTGAPAGSGSGAGGSGAATPAHPAHGGAWARAARVLLPAAGLAAVAGLLVARRRARRTRRGVGTERRAEPGA